jgi:hypothetical protein
MTNESLVELRRIASSATPGPWEKAGRETCVPCVYARRPAPLTPTFVARVRYGRRDLNDGEANATFIATFNPALIRELLAEVTKVEGLECKQRMDCARRVRDSWLRLFVVSVTLACLAWLPFEFLWWAAKKWTWQSSVPTQCLNCEGDDLGVPE